MIVKIANEADRITVAGILFKNGYTIRQIKLKFGNRNISCIEAIEKEPDRRVN